MDTSQVNEDEKDTHTCVADATSRWFAVSQSCQWVVIDQYGIEIARSTSALRTSHRQVIVRAPITRLVLTILSFVPL